MLPGAQGEAAGLSHVAEAMFAEFGPRLKQVLAYNSPLSESGLRNGAYTADTNKQTRDITELYVDGVGEQNKNNPTIIIGHSLGAKSSIDLAESLLKQGYNIQDVILIAPPGLVKRKSGKLLTDLMKLSSPHLTDQDIPSLHPNPQDKKTSKKELSVLYEKQEKGPISQEEQEQIALHRLSEQRFSQPDQLIAGNISPEDSEKVDTIDSKFLQVPENKQARMERKRNTIIGRSIKKVIQGKIKGESSHYAYRSKYILTSLFKSINEMRRTLKEAAGTSTIDQVQSLIDYNNTLKDHKLAITILGGNDDPIVGDYELGDVDSVHVGANTTLSEVKMPNFSHYNFVNNAKRTADTINRIIET